MDFKNYKLNVIPAIGKLLDEAIAVDTETALSDQAIEAGIKKIKGSTPYHQKLEVISIYSPSQGLFLLEWNKLKDSERARQALGAILQSRRITKRFHNAVFDLHFLISNGFEVNNTACSMVLSQVVFGGDLGQLMRKRGFNPYSLAGLSRFFFNVKLDKSSQTFDWDSFDPVRDRQQAEYAVSDAYWCYQVFDCLLKLVKDWRALDIEMRAIEVFARISASGIPIDPDLIAKNLSLLQAEVTRLAPYFEGLNFRSPKQVISWFLNEFGFEVPTILVKGKPKRTTAKEAIFGWMLNTSLAQDLDVRSCPNSLTQEDEFSELTAALLSTHKTISAPLSYPSFIAWMQCMDAIINPILAEITAVRMRVFIQRLSDSRYYAYLVNKFESFSNPFFVRNNRVYSLLQPLAFDSYSDETNGMGRGSTFSGTPTIQIMPKQNVRSVERLGIKSFRKVFRASPGHKLISLDVAGSHARIAAILSGDKGMAGVHDRGIKVHYYTLSNVSGLIGTQYTPEECQAILEDPAHPDYGNLKHYYRLVKIVFFAKLNMAGAETIRKQFTKSEIAITDSELKVLLDAYEKGYPGLVSYTKRTINRAKSAMVPINLPRLNPDDSYDAVKSIAGYLSQCKVTLTGQTFYINPHYKGNRAVSSQWLAAEAAGMKLFMCRVDDLIQSNPEWKIRICAMVHDELLFEAPDEYAVEFTTQAQQLMIQSMEDIIPGFDCPESSVESLIRETWG